MGQPITKIAIVGGGTAGWIVAAYLNHRLQWGITARPDVHLTVVESPNTPTIGVGEATTPMLRATLRALDISEDEFILRTDATLKLGTRFKHWQSEDPRIDDSFGHPFTGGGTLHGRNPGYSFIHYGLPGRPAMPGSAFLGTISHSFDVIEAAKAPRRLDGPEFHGEVRYAYHLDAGKFATFLKEICLARGVTYRADEVLEAKRDARGHITDLQLEKSGALPVELVIDCTGFQGIVINRILKEPFVSYADYLPNDRALAVQVERPESNRIEPVTVSTALRAGWCWRVPLYSRDGTGYVYSSAFSSDSAAEDELASHLAGATQLTTPRMLKMRIGRSQRSWVGNCIAIGLSSGFLEPLESTGILSIELASRCLLQNFPTTEFEDSLRNQFNGAMARAYDEIRDFISLHFSLNGRHDSPYWQAARHEAKISDNLSELRELWKHTMPSAWDPRTRLIFGNWSIQCILFGKDFYRDAGIHSIEIVHSDIWRRYCAHISAARRSLLSRLPDHLALVEAIRARASHGASVAKRPRGQDFTIDSDSTASLSNIMSPMPSTVVDIGAAG